MSTCGTVSAVPRFDRTCAEILKWQSMNAWSVAGSMTKILVTPTAALMPAPNLTTYPTTGSVLCVGPRKKIFLKYKFNQLNHRLEYRLDTPFYYFLYLKSNYLASSFFCHHLAELSSTISLHPSEN